MDWCTSTCSCDSFWIVLCRYSWLYQAILSDTSHLLSKVVMPNSWRSKCREFITDAPLVNPLDAVGDTCWRKPDSVCHKDVRGRHEHLLFHRFDYSILCPYTIDSEVNRFGGGHLCGIFNDHRHFNVWLFHANRKDGFIIGGVSWTFSCVDDILCDGSIKGARNWIPFPMQASVALCDIGNFIVLCPYIHDISSLRYNNTRNKTLSTYLFVLLDYVAFHG